MRLGLGAPVENWREHARCLGSNEEFFIEEGGPMQRAKAICNQCAVWRECLASALGEAPAEHDYGIRGGTSVMDRRWFRRVNAFRRRRGYSWLECVLASEEQIVFHVLPVRKRRRERNVA